MEEKTYEEIVKNCRSTKTSYIDSSFPPIDQNIGEEVSRRANWRFDLPIEGRNLHWLRPHQIKDEEGEENIEWCILDNPQPSDVRQSCVIGDCALIAAMSAVAEHPEMLDMIFPSRELSAEGVYPIRLKINGEWRTIIVDDYFPCFIHSGKLATAIGKRKQLWVPLIEKAMAKVMGGYSVLDEGFRVQIPLSMLTGADCVNYSPPKHPEEFDDFWNLLMNARSSGFLLCCGSLNDESKLEGTGIFPSHAHTILALRDENQNRLLRIRDPWGHSDWGGKWSESIRPQLLIDWEEDDGTFWMELEEFVAMFACVIVCKIRPNWYGFRENVMIGLDTIKLTVREACEASFSVMYRIPESMEVFDTMISIHQISEDNIIGEMIGRSRNRLSPYVSTDDMHLSPGRYIVILLKIMNNVNTPRILLCYSSKPISHEPIPQSTQMLNHALRQIVLKDGRLRESTVDGVVWRTMTRNFRGKIFMVDNLFDDKYIHFKDDIVNYENVQTSRKGLLTIDVVPPRSYQILKIITDIDSEAMCKYANDMRIYVKCENSIGQDMTEDQSIIGQNLQNYPIIDPLDPIHYPQSIDFGLKIEKKCRKGIRYFCGLCDC